MKLKELIGWLLLLIVIGTGITTLATDALTRVNAFSESEVYLGMVESNYQHEEFTETTDSIMVILKEINLSLKESRSIVEELAN